MTDVNIVVGKKGPMRRLRGWIQHSVVQLPDGRRIGTIRTMRRQEIGVTERLTIDTTGRAVTGADVPWLLRRAKEEGIA